MQDKFKIDQLLADLAPHARDQITGTINRVVDDYYWELRYRKAAESRLRHALTLPTIIVLLCIIPQAVLFLVVLGKKSDELVHVAAIVALVLDFLLVAYMSISCMTMYTST